MCMLVLRIIGPQVVRLLLLGLCSDAPSPPLPSSDFFLGEGASVHRLLLLGG